MSTRTPQSRCLLHSVLIFAVLLVCSTSFLPKRPQIYASAFSPKGLPHLSSKCFDLHFHSTLIETSRVTNVEPRWRQGYSRGSPQRKSMSIKHSSTSLHHDIDAQLEEEDLAPLSSSQVATNELELNNVQKLLNAVLLILSFGWALYTILKVDEGMTRGWTQQEIMMRIPIDNWRTYEYNLHESPIETKTFINVIIYLLGDWLSQTIFQKNNALDFDAGRTLKNGFIGLW